MSIYVLLTYKEYCDKVNETMTFEGLHRYKKKYWRDYYEMNQEHEQIVEELYLKKMTNDSFLLDAVQKEKLMEWFGEEITYCKQSLEEIGIMFD